MNADLTKINNIIQFALLIAGEEDDFIDRQLGPIHLLKYVYLADLYFSKRENGETFTKVDWSFFNFGPWSPVVHSQIKPALEKIGAKCQTIESSYNDEDFYRWSLQNSRLLRDMENQLPFSISTKLRQTIHKYLKNTPSLLDYVYKTEPMLKAAPNEILNFKITVRRTKQDDKTELRMDGLSIKKKKIFKTKMTELRKEFKKRKLNRPRLKNPVINPRFDEIFNKGIEWLDTLAGEQLKPIKVIAKFTDDVWKSNARKGDDVS